GLDRRCRSAHAGNPFLRELRQRRKPKRPPGRSTHRARVQSARPRPRRDGMKSRVWRSVVVLVAVVLMGAACSSNNSETTTGASPTESGSESGGGTITIGSDTANNHGSKDVSG